MKVTVDCIPCYLTQCKNALLKAEVKEDDQFQILNNLLPIISGLDNNSTPAENSTIILHRLVDMIGGNDPYKKAKYESNELAESYLPKLNKIISESKNPLHTALKLSVAGNVIDLGIFQDYDIEASIKDVLNTDFALDDYNAFVDLLKISDSILIIGDNSGEIVFDKLLLKELKKDLTNIVYGVKGGFIINDATNFDAQQVGISKLARVITNGNNYLGTVENQCSGQFLEAMEYADIIISKGQANYETLESTKLAGEKTFFLLKAKCPVVAENLGVKYGDIIFTRNKWQEF